jgi:predicted RNA-binding Zn-ribbon protein involved in translation (DUF1610 family)
MKNYYLYIKSHTEAPDYADTCRAKSREKAVRIFTKRINQAVHRATDMGGEWDSADINRYVSPDEVCPICGGDLVDKIEAREGGYSEHMYYCDKCGYTGVAKEGQ